MLTLSEQTAFITETLTGLGRWLELPELPGFAAELAGKDELKADIEAAVAPVDFFRTKSWDGVLRLGLYRATQYSLMRAINARSAIETGVLHGLSSAFLLQGLADNGGGKLYSVDYPSAFEEGPSNADGFTDTLPPGKDSGWAVPQRLRPYWDLRLGKSSDLVPAILDEIGSVDLFVHDSEHTWATMTLEFEMVWPRLAPGGILIADNIDCNTSFYDFARAVGAAAHVLPVDPDHYAPGGSGIRFGVLRK